MVESIAMTRCRSAAREPREEGRQAGRKEETVGEGLETLPLLHPWLVSVLRVYAEHPSARQAPCAYCPHGADLVLERRCLCCKDTEERADPCLELHSP